MEVVGKDTVFSVPLSSKDIVSIGVILSSGLKLSCLVGDLFLAKGSPEFLNKKKTWCFSFSFLAANYRFCSFWKLKGMSC
jgi:hypothetical protein